jgi:putative nucleotidyltransferase with HDIG domain
MATLTSTSLQRILRDIEQLKPLPTNVLRVMRALNNPDVSASTVADLISLDQALTANILRLANSAFMGYTAPSASVHQAVVRIGFQRVRTLVLGAGASQAMRDDLAGYEIKSADLWQHALVAASIARYLAAAVGNINMEDAYISGLLHDIGKVVLDQYVRVDYQAIKELMQPAQLPLWQVEKQQLGMDHGAVGGLMTERWLFPVNLVEAIRYHHAPAIATTRCQPHAAIVNIANALATRPQTGLASLNDLSPLDPEALRILNLDETQLADLQAAMPDFNDIDLKSFDR